MGEGVSSSRCLLHGHKEKLTHKSYIYNTIQRGRSRRMSFHVTVYGSVSTPPHRRSCAHVADSRVFKTTRGMFFFFFLVRKAKKSEHTLETFAQFSQHFASPEAYTMLVIRSFFSFGLVQVSNTQKQKYLACRAMKFGRRVWCRFYLSLLLASMSN